MRRADDDAEPAEPLIPELCARYLRSELVALEPPLGDVDGIPIIEFAAHLLPVLHTTR